MKPYSTSRQTRGTKYALRTDKSPTTKRALRVDKKRARRTAKPDYSRCQRCDKALRDCQCHESSSSAGYGGWGHDD